MPDFGPKKKIIVPSSSSMNVANQRVTPAEASQRQCLKENFLWQQGFGAADKAAIQRVKVPSCQLPDSGM